MIVKRSSLPKRINPNVVKAETVGKNTTKFNKRHLSSSLTIECYNYTGYVIKTLDHLGICMIHEPISTAPDDNSFIGKFVIRRIQLAHERTQLTDMSDAIKGNDRYQALDLTLTDSIILDANHNQREQLLYRTSILSFSVPNMAITENGGYIYIRDVDLVVMNQNHPPLVTHPNSPKGIDYIIDQLYESIHSYNVEINDPTNADSLFYINLNDRVFKITPTRNINLGPEVRVTFKQPNQPAETIYLKTIDDEELEKFGIFRNYVDADNYARRYETLKQEHEMRVIQAKSETEDIKLNALREQTNLKVSSEQASVEAKLRELDAKQIALQREHELEIEKMKAKHASDIQTRELEAERHQRAIEKMRRDDYYDNRSSYRKDSSESLKMLPVFVGGAMALFALMK